MRTDAIRLVDFGDAHLDGAVALSAEAGWPHRRDDWALVLSLGRGFVALEGDRVVGTAMVVPYGRTAATVNMVIVAAAMRGRGLGRRLMAAALAACGDRECRLVATRDGLPLYETLGFLTGAEIRQHQGPVAAGAAPPAATGVDIAWAAPADIAAVAEVDRLAIGMDRRPLIDRLAEIGRIAVLRRRGDVAGFAALRAFGRGEAAGPGGATTADDARVLLAHLVAGRGGRFLRVDIPEATGLAPWLEGLGLAHVGGGIAMRRGAVAAEASAFETYALASQALG